MTSANSNSGSCNTGSSIVHTSQPINHSYVLSSVIRQVREIIFEFRSPEAQGLLLYQTLRNPPPDEPKYELYVLLEGGELKTIHVFGANETTLLVGKGLNRDWWHRVKINVDPNLALLQVQVDDETQSIVIEGLDKDEAYNRRQHINSTIFIGGNNSLQIIQHCLNFNMDVTMQG